MKYIILFVAILFLTSFARENTQDTLTVSGNLIIFYETPQSEYDTLSNLEIFRIDSVISYFKNIRERTIPFFRKNEIRDEIVRSRFIKIMATTDTTIFDRKIYKEAGIILCRTDKPPIILGFISEADLLSKSQEYFKVLIKR